MENIYSFIDLEATSNDPENSEIIEVAIITYKGTQYVSEYQSLIKPAIKIPEHIVNLTGISNKMCKEAREFNQIGFDLYELLKDTTLVAHSVKFDYELLRRAFKKLGIDFQAKTICTLEQSQKFIPGLNSYSLSALSAIFDIKHTESHRARSDAFATKELYFKVKETFYPKKQVKTIIHPNFKGAYEASKTQPAVITINNESFVVNNEKQYFEDNLSLQIKNYEFINCILSFSSIPYSSYCEALLSLNKTYKQPRWVLYFAKTKDKLGFFVGKYKPGRPAPYYFEEKKDAFNKRSSLFDHIKVSRNDVDFHKHLSNQVDSDSKIHSNTLLSSLSSKDDLYSHILIKDGRYFAIVKSTYQDLDLTKIKRVRWSVMSPLLEMKIRSHIQNFKNQITKTESLKEVKKDIMNSLFASYAKKRNRSQHKNKVAKKSNSNRKIVRNNTHANV